MGNNEYSIIVKQGYFIWSMSCFFVDDSDETERTVTEDKQADMSLLSDEGLEVSVILSDNQGSLDVQNDETVVGKS